jgi:hypothetical protein
MEYYNPYEKTQEDYSIEKSYLTSYNALDSTKFGKSDIIKFRILDLNANTLPSQSYLYMKVKIHGAGDAKLNHAKLTNNAFLFLFDEARYTLNGVEATSERDIGRSGVVKGIMLYSPSDAKRAVGTGWRTPGDGAMEYEVDYDVMIPLSMILNLFKDYTKLLTNIRQEFTLIRSRSDNNCFKIPAGETETPEIEVKDAQFCMKQIELSDEARAPLLANTNKRRPITIAWRQWELLDNPNVLTKSPFTWSLKTTSQSERPKWVIVFLQTKKNDTVHEDATQFDNCKLRSVRVNINNEFYPHEEYDTDFSKNQTARLYESYVQFQQSYSFKEPEPLLTREQFTKTNPMVVIDCSKHVQPIMPLSGAVDVKVVLECAEDIPKETTAYCMLIYDKSIQYEPISGHVTRIV